MSMWKKGGREWGLDEVGLREARLHREGGECVGQDHGKRVKSIHSPRAIRRRREWRCRMEGRLLSNPKSLNFLSKMNNWDKQPVSNHARRRGNITDNSDDSLPWCTDVTRLGGRSAFAPARLNIPRVIYRCTCAIIFTHKSVCLRIIAAEIRGFFFSFFIVEWLSTGYTLKLCSSTPCGYSSSYSWITV